MEGEGRCWAGEETERHKERTTVVRIAWVPFLSPCSERKGEALGLGGACFGEHVAAPFGALGSVRGFGPVREVDRSRIRILQVMIRSMGFVLRVLRNDWKVLTEE